MWRLSVVTTMKGTKVEIIIIICSTKNSHVLQFQIYYAVL